MNAVSSVDDAFEFVPRSEFLPDELQNKAYQDRALPIGFGQTNSQPSTVKQMLEWLQVEPGNKILDVGSGSGWTTALLSVLTGPYGFVYAVEKVPELLTFGAANCMKLGINNVMFLQAGDVFGYPKFAPYDRILVSAQTERLPAELTNQLQKNGKMVIPLKDEIYEIEKSDNDSFEISRHFGYMFVPLVR